MTEQIDLRREIAELSIADLARCRRARKAHEEKIATETETERKLFTQAEELLEVAKTPFAAELKKLQTEEEAAEVEAAESLQAFESARRELLLAGTEVKKLKPADGVTIKWLDRAKVVNPDELPDDFWIVDSKKLNKELKENAAIAGVQRVQVPSFSVGEES